IAFAIFVVYWLSRLLHVDKTLGLLTACGTGICGASAVVAIASQIKAKDDQTAIGAVTVSILGTIFTVVYTFLYPYLGLSPHQFGILSGATLHEIGHVLAAAAPAGSEALNIAIVVKLIRVALLVGVAIVVGIWAKRTESGQAERQSWKSIPIPWFIFGFLA
ncbi:putative sulfate exporter family transporter, partial [Frankia sp. Cpl3]|nr:putative sulfate exporter family transporter [Frankia sp. Cpl3]